MPTVRERLWALIDFAGPSMHPELGPCWIWLGTRTSGGRARFWLNGQHVDASRFVYELIRGPIREGLSLRALCSTPHCVSPVHREAGPPTCVHGHPRTPENTYRSEDSRKTACRECRRIEQRERYRRRTVAVPVGVTELVADDPHTL